MIRRFMVLVVALLAISLAACKCPAAKASVTQIEGTHDLVSIMLLDYIQKDTAIDEKEKTRRRGLLATDKENIDKLKKDLEQ